MYLWGGGMGTINLVPTELSRFKIRSSYTFLFFQVSKVHIIGRGTHTHIF